MKKIVTFGGGNGSAETLQALKQLKEECDISAVISMSDSGGSSGVLRREFESLPPGDVLRAVLALSPWDYETILKPIFYKTRFTETGKLDSHNLGNLFLVLAGQYGGFLPAVRALEQAVEAQGKVYPVTLDSTDLVGELESGTVVRGEASLDRPEPGRNDSIKRVWLEPAGSALPEILSVVGEADIILLGPASLYCSLVASLLPTGIKEAIKNSRAKIVYIAGNKYETNGETGPIVLSEFVHELEVYLPRKVDTIIFNEFDFTEEQKQYYKEKNFERVVFDKENLQEYELIAKSFEKQSGGIDFRQLGYIFSDILK